MPNIIEELCPIIATSERTHRIDLNAVILLQPLALTIKTNSRSLTKLLKGQNMVGIVRFHLNEKAVYEAI